MSQIPSDHLEYLQRGPFILGCSDATFPIEEVAALVRRGCWMEALADGLLRPFTTAQQHFLQVDRGEVEPATIYERAWRRLKDRRVYEHEQRIAPPPPPTEDYGIIDFDVDRWW